MKEIKGLNKKELTEVLAAMGEKPYRAGQIYDWLHKRLARSFDEMTNIPLTLREKLAAEWSLTPVTIETVQESALDGTKKYLLGYEDGNFVEAVWMRYHHGVSVCISTQVGCRMGCSFCASTLGGKIRDLSAAEMLEEIYTLTRDNGERISNIVLMGIGEPLDNYEHVVKFLRLLTDPDGMNISQRSITISTCGLTEGIRRLADEGLSVTLALSLHAATDEKRQQIMPVAKRYSIQELTSACSEYFAKTGRRISFEYALIADVNDTEEDASALSWLATRCGAHVNLIPVNPVTERGYREPGREKAEAFCKRLADKHVNATIRRELGRDIDGACGQLRHKRGIS